MDPVDLDGNLFAEKTVELTGVQGEHMVSFRSFSRGDVLDSESAVAEDQRSSERRVRQTTEKDSKANVKSNELSEVIGVDTEGKPRQRPYRD